jgi:hypothetical protein
MENSLAKFEKDIEEIKQRNFRVEADKAWETSFTRKACIAILTYIIAVLVMSGIKAQPIFLNALIPTIGYILSTQSLPLIKRWWLRSRPNK